MGSGADLSLAQRVALLPEREREAALEGLDPDELQYSWDLWGRPSQMLPDDESWTFALYLAGRGSGKTRGGTEWARKKAMGMPGSRGIIVARTAADARDVLVDGDSGILAVHPPGERPLWEPSKRRLTWPNRSVATVFSADQPDVLRGPQSDWTLADEIATWDQTPDSSGLTAFDNARIATRLGKNPQLVAMTTPKRIPLIRKLLDEIEGSGGRQLLKRGRTADNAGNLAQSYLDYIYGLYKGTALETQELEGQLLGAVEGALWSADEIRRVGALPPAAGLGRAVVVVGVDPSVSERRADECGIVVMLGTMEAEVHLRRLYVLADLSGQMTPSEWAGRAAAAAVLYGGVVVAETNQGGALVAGAIRNVNPTVRVVGVHSRVGKAIRAEPVVLASQQGRLSFVGEFPLLEDQMTSWEPGVSRHSPDRLDALVHAATAFLVPDPRVVLGWGEPLRITGNAQRARAGAVLRRRSVLVPGGGGGGGIPDWQRASLRGLFGR